GDERRRRDQRAALPQPEGDHGRQEEAARHQGDRRRRDRGGSGRRIRLAHGRPRAEAPAREGGRGDHRGRGHERDGREDRRLARRKEASLMGGILVYALHDDEGNFNKNSLGAISEASKLAGELGSEAAAVVVGDIADDACAGLGAYGAAKVYRSKTAPEGLAQPIVDVMAKVITDNGYDYALFGGGLLGFEIGAGLTARLNAGVTMEVTAVVVEDGKLAAERPIHGDSSISTSRYKDRGIIIGRLNAFEAASPSDDSAEVVDVDVELSDFSSRMTMVQRGEQRGED